CWLGTIAGLAVHLVADDLDGYIARSRGLSSKAGAYYDLIVDVLFSTFLIISIGVTPAAHLLPMALAAPLYGIINVTMMNYIIYFNEFQFPRLGPIEAHLSYTAIAICAMIFGGKEVITVAGHGATVVDILAVIAMIPMYYEMIRMIITLYKRLEESQK
ncbi:CDP-alcohol phosphatidyltransferase family protein, partial [uncultured Ruminococcus sp.]|uniref:CDP-alcohol phosphatidyltransferase family protein n=1 Tax=uncultured Ruminococcus sp. TaxID=165186 RepID=UPI0025EADF1C